MISAEILNSIEQIELITRKLLSGEISGDYRTHFKGSGFEFDQLREYQQGDDVRFIDWKSSARSQKVLIKQYLEDRNKIVILAVDCSASTYYGSSEQTKSDLIKTVTGILAFAGLFGKDSVGLMLFTNEIELFIPPNNSKEHIVRLVTKIFEYKPKNKNSNFENSLKQLNKYISKRVLICVVSDFMFNLDNKILTLLNNMHDLIFLRCIDKIEENFPDVGILEIQDLETGAIKCINTNGVANISNVFFNKQNFQFKNLGIDFTTIYTHRPIINELSKFFFKRSLGRI